MCAGNAVLTFMSYMILIKKLNHFNYEEKNAHYEVQKTQSRRTVDTEMGSNVGIVKSVSVHLSGRIKRINTSESLYGFDGVCVKDIQLVNLQV